MNLLAYSKPREPQLEMVNPQVLIDECLELIAADGERKRRDGASPTSTRITPPSRSIPMACTRC